MTFITTTLYPSLDPDDPSTTINRVRFACTQRTVANAVRLGHRIYVLDESPEDTEVAKLLQELGAIMVDPLEHTGMARGRAYVAEVALRNGHLPMSWVDPEKDTFITDPTIALMVDMVGSDIDAVRPMRTTEAMDSYPIFQSLSEMQGNYEIFLETGVYHDHYFGPFAMLSSDVVDIWIEEHRWPGATYAHVDACIRTECAAYSVARVIAPTFRYPPEQRDAEMDSEDMQHKRKMQRGLINTSVRSLCQRLGIEGVRAL